MVIQAIYDEYVSIHAPAGGATVAYLTNYPIRNYLHSCTNPRFVHENRKITILQYMLIAYNATK